MIKLSNTHIVIESNLAQQFFGNALQLNYAYENETKNLLMASVLNTSFHMSHKPQKGLFKIRNESGDRSFSIQEIILDHDLDEQNRELKFVADTQSKIITINL